MNTEERNALVREMVEGGVIFEEHDHYTLSDANALVDLIKRRLLSEHHGETTVPDDRVERAAKAMHQLWLSDSEASPEEIEEDWAYHLGFTMEMKWEPTPRFLEQARAALDATDAQDHLEAYDNGVAAGYVEGLESARRHIAVMSKPLDMYQISHEIGQEIRSYQRDIGAPSTAIAAAGPDLQREIALWAKQTFDKPKQDHRLTKLGNEFEELRRLTTTDRANQAGIADECADIMHLMFQIAEAWGFDLLDETRKKFEVNKQRTWAAQPDGTYQHREEPRND